MTETVHLDAEYLRQRYLNEGYVLFRGVLDKEKVLRMRQQYFEQFADTIFREGTSRTEGIFSGKLQYKPSEHGLEHHPASAFVRTAIFDEFTRNPTLFELSASLLGAQAH
ncbi:MAG: hypothetical protein EBZ77_00325 [Chitinophagia bacterium]|nr:hypothetical protein [Chitinophagia bacterium]